MIEVVGVIFGKCGKVYYFLPNNLMLTVGTDVIVETEHGLQFGKIALGNRKIEADKFKSPLNNVVREATSADCLKHKKNIDDGKAALIKCKRLVNKHNLRMNVIDASFTFKRDQLLFRFSASERVDFRKLVRDLAAIYKTRIELRQIGVRDEASEVGGIGPCGRPICCANFLTTFDMVSINLAKNQNIALNPNKINGLCGRLLCCLTYEDEQYKKYRRGLPEIGDVVKVKEGRGKVVAVNILKSEYKVDVPKKGIIVVNKN